MLMGLFALASLDTDRSVGRVVQLLKLKLFGSTGFEVYTLFIQIPINTLEVGDLHPHLRPSELFRILITSATSGF